MKNLLAFIGLAIVISFTFSCKDKNSSSAIKPDYSATGNPYPNNQTVTGSTTFTSPATQNTSLLVGDIGWSNPTCASSQSLSLKGTKDNIDVILVFNTAITSGTYAISQIPGSGTCQMTVLNAPNQPAGVYWIGKSGSVIVSTSSTSINANLINVVCTQKDFNFPQVTVTGVLGCN
ncbi:hypothetical protein CNR22_17560 [Sphingobacteriaceae bacterium]|nr:hypothetical protein CNR22_17560 [Sphingobacteriaceae bacterium]